MPIKVVDVYEEATYRPFPEWIVEEEDKRVFSGASFGVTGDAWATVFSAQLVLEDRLLAGLSKRLGRFSHLLPPVTNLIADELWLRVCSPTFEDTDPRFVRGDRHLALVQDHFDRVGVEDYFRGRVTDVEDRRLPAAFTRLQRYFYVVDPTE